ncbi:uncharacterized protein LOC131942871 isoform X2 [Physella acuta]|uniref:uncharacterized protein LOC131942871 isoform X2 n=1 Tax=Physella acuta TaxID=109671 RepID=UPI0027DB0FA3|nr:uncharacterized protein LOC131942871 isoform X2 [Physella acuta]
MENRRGKGRELQLADGTNRKCQATQLDKMKTKAGFIPGHHEAEICNGGEANLPKRYTSCKKNPGHARFIPVNDFNLNHLPSRYHDVIMLEVIKALSALTVLVKVNYTSQVRPRRTNLFIGQYPFYNTRGTDVLRTGTGRVYQVDKYTKSDNKGTCPCGKCQHSDTPSKVWGEVHVRTATHVVFDESEARQTRCVVGFDDNKSPGVGLDGWKVRKADVDGDWCLFSCVSCDLELVDQLDKAYRNFDDLWEKVSEKYTQFVDVDKLTVIVSHPHGCPKKVSVGQWTQKHVRDDGWYKYMYTTCTCPGSSGACVYMPGYVRWRHPHSGSNSEGNYSGNGWT